MNSGKTQFEKFLNAYWQNNDPETAMLLWKRQLYSNPQTAGTYLNCLDQIIADPPEELPKIMMTEGWIGLFHEDTDIDYTFEEYLEWLRKMKAEFQKAYDDFTSTPTFLLRELMQYFFLVKSEPETLKLWRELSENDPDKARSYLNALDELIKNPSPDLANIVQTFGRIHLMHHDGTPYTVEEQVNWLKSWKAKLEAVAT